MQDFNELCQDKLLELADKIESNDENSVFDVEYSDGILQITIESSGQQYVINQHSATQKIWYSSPLSGADYFSFEISSKKWLNSKGDELEKKLFNELKF